jgi:two-component system sensor histidine kinase PilS (NtrC family)
MEQTLNRREWLEWLTRVRLLMIALILGVGTALPQYIPFTGSPRYFLPIIVLWITIAILQVILVRLVPSVSWMGGLQVICDIFMITGIVYATGLQDSYFTTLYLLIIIVASILFTRRFAFITAVFCLISLGSINCADVLRANPADLCTNSFRRKPADVVPQQFGRLFGRRVSG